MILLAYDTPFLNVPFAVGPERTVYHKIMSGLIFRIAAIRKTFECSGILVAKGRTAVDGRSQIQGKESFRLASSSPQ